MGKGKFDMLYLCAGEGVTIFFFDKSTSLEGSQKKNPEMIRGASKE